jgi:hypothetical protein
MCQWTGGEANDALHEQDAYYAVQYPAPTIKKLLETEDLREFDGDIIERLAEELHEMIRSIRDEPATVLPFAPPKEAVLANLRNASAQLNLAWNQLGAKGKPIRFYHCLLRCKEYLEKVFGQNASRTRIQENTMDQHSPTTLSSTSIASLSPEIFLSQLQAFLHEFEEMQLELQHIYEIFCYQDRLWATQCNEAVATLSTLSEYLQNIRELLFGSVQLPFGLPSPGYDVMVKLYNIEEQVRSLISLITSFRAICQAKSKQVIRLTEEIRNKLEVLIQSDKDAWQMITLQIRQLQPQASGTGRRLRLVHSME